MNTQSAVAIFKEHLIDQAVNEVMSYFTAKVTWLALPIINPITRVIIALVIRVLITKTALGLYFVYSYMVVKEQADSLKKAIEKQQENPTNENENELIDSFRDLIKLRT